MGITESLFGKEEPEGNPNLEPKPTEEGEKEPEKKEGEEKKPYTPEEVAELLKAGDFGKIDTARLSPEGQLVMKSMQKGLTPKLEEGSAAKKKLAEALDRISNLEKKGAKDKTLEDFFEDDPEGTLSYIDRIILQKVQESDQYEEEGDEKASRKALKDAMVWTATRSKLVGQKSLQTVKELTKSRERDKITSTVADFDTKKEVASKIMQEQTGLGEDEIADLLDPEKNGKKAIGLIKHFYEVHEKAQVAVTAKDKIKKEAPAPLGRPGSPPDSKNDDFDYAAEFKKAQETDDWTRILKYKGVI